MNAGPGLPAVTPAADAAPRPVTVEAPALLSLHAMPGRAVGRRWPRPGLTVVLLAMVSVWVALGGWAAWGTVDTFTSGLGRIVPAQTVQVIQALEGGILVDLPVAEGTMVEEGQVVARISDVAAVSEYQQARAKQLAMLAAIARLDAEIAGRAPEMPADLRTPEGQPFIEREVALYRARVAEVASSLSVIEGQRDQRRQELYGLEERARGLRDMLGPLRGELAMTQDLSDRGYRPRIELLRMQQRMADTEGQLRAAVGQVPAVRASIREAEQRLVERQRAYDSQVRAELSLRHAELAATTEVLRNLRDRVERRDLRAPLRGEVKQIRLKSIGGVLQPGQVLMEIVPAGDLLMVEVPVQPSDIAFIAPGIPARIKVTAYDYTRHGWLAGTVDLISPDVIINDKGEAFFQVRVRPDRNSLGPAERPLPILPGMMATVDIVTGHQTVMHYILKPVIRATDRALSER